MFNFLKKGIKNALNSFKKKEEEEIEESEEAFEEKELGQANELKTQSRENKSTTNENKEETKDNEIEERKDNKNEDKEKNENEETKETQIETKAVRKINPKEFEDMFENFEISLLESNVAFPVVEKIKERLLQDLTKKKGRLSKIMKDSLKETISDIVSIKPIDVLKEAKSKKPYVILLVGVNGTGKTTTIAKLAKYFKNNNLSVVVSASDTFRAASIEQLEYHCKKLNVELIKHNYNSDPASVAYDAIAHAKSKGMDIVLIDSAGRLHTNINLMKELEKVKRVSNPDLTLLVVDALTGNDAVEQAETFNKLGLSGVIVAKTDVDEKGGVILSLAEILKKPIVFLGTGQEYDDLKPFDAQEYVEQLFED